MLSCAISSCVAGRISDMVSSQPSSTYAGAGASSPTSVYVICVVVSVRLSASILIVSALVKVATMSREPPGGRCPRFGENEKSGCSGHSKRAVVCWSELRSVSVALSSVSPLARLSSPNLTSSSASPSPSSISTSFVKLTALRLTVCISYGLYITRIVKLAACASSPASTSSPPPLSTTFFGAKRTAIEHVSPGASWTLEPACLTEKPCASTCSMPVGSSTSTVAGTMPLLRSATAPSRVRPRCSRPMSSTTAPASSRSSGASSVTVGSVPRPARSNVRRPVSGSSPSLTVATKRERYSRIASGG